MPPSLLVHTLEVSVTQQARAPGKGDLSGSKFARPRFDGSGPNGSRFDTPRPDDIMIRFSRDTGSHSDSKFQIAILQRTCEKHWHNSGLRGRLPAPLDYSRNPGFTETRLRPLARRREITFLPPWVFMRVRNPCFLTRLRRLGWNVRLGMKNSCS